MGRRSINTTKSGKYMNPTDQASKYQSFSAFIQDPVKKINIQFQERKLGKKN